MSKQPQELGFLLRCKYVKQNRLRFLAHLEVLRTIERTVRRAGLPYAVTYGFSPHMRIGFSSALGVGVASSDEYFDLLLRSFIPTDQALAALQRASVADLMVTDAAYVDRQATSLSAALTVSLYRVQIEVPELTVESLADATDALIASNELSFLKKGKMKSVSLQDKLFARPHIIKKAGGGLVMLLATRALPTGSLRADTFVYHAVNAALASLPSDQQSDDESSYLFDVTAISFERCGQWALSDDEHLISAFAAGVPPERKPREKVYRPRT